MSASISSCVSRGVWRLFQIALSQYQRTLESYAALDFAEVLARAVGLLKQMEEFSQSRYKLEARYQHVLVDEFQDTNRAQWELMSLLVRSWGEGFGASADAKPQSSIAPSASFSTVGSDGTIVWPNRPPFITALRLKYIWSYLDNVRYFASWKMTPMANRCRAVGSNPS